MPFDNDDIDRVKLAVGEKLDAAEMGLRRAERDVRAAVDHLREQGPLFEPKTRAGRAAFYGCILAALAVAFWLGTALS